MSVDEQEAAFQAAFDRWQESCYCDKEAWEQIWLRVHEACKALAGKIMKGIYSDKFDERVMDATIYYVGRIHRDHIRPKKLSSWCYLYTKGQLQGEKSRREDREISLDEYYGSI